MKTINQKKRQKPPYNPYIKFVGVASQMLASILIGVWVGGWLDKYFEVSRPYFTLILCLLGIFSSLYSLYKELIYTQKSSRDKNK